MGNLKKVFKFISNLDEVLGYLAIGGVTFFTFINVILRYAFDFTISAAEEASLMAFIWLSYLGVAAAFKVDEHIAIDIVIDMLPPKARKVADFIIMVVLTLISAVYTYYSYILTANTGLKATPVLKLNYAWINVSLVVCFGLMTIYGVIKCVRIIQGKSTKLHDTGMVDVLEAIRLEKAAEEAAAKAKEDAGVLETTENTNNEDNKVKN